MITKSYFPFEEYFFRVKVKIVFVDYLSVGEKANGPYDKKLYFGDRGNAAKQVSQHFTVAKYKCKFK
jgi:hypothetical protein